MSKTLFFSICLLSVLVVSSQNHQEDVVVIGTTHTMYSDILNETRTYHLYLPDSYKNNSAKDFPVVYLLDASINFHSYTGIQHMLSRGRNGRGVIPEMIVVGIVNTNRIRDFTPTRAKKLPEKFMSNKKMLEDGGGLENFLFFIENELRPVINKSYRTNGNNVLIGHSLGGLATLYTLLNHSKLFSHYLAIDPSFWWDDEMLLKMASEKLTTSVFSNVNLFFTSANHHNEIESAVRMEQVLKHFMPNELRWNYRHYENETHGSVIVPSEYDGLKFLFRD